MSRSAEFQVTRIGPFAAVLRPALLALVMLTSVANASGFAGVGRPATPAEIKAWDIDVRPDFTGLPKGSGSVQKGQSVWDSRCASCHGSFGESNEVFAPIVGGTRPEDMKTGRVASLASGSQPQRTTLMKLPTLSTLWDYINRAMPWNEPKSLTVEEVYAVTAYILNMGEIVPDDFVLSDRNMAEVQAKLPNRNGMSSTHGLWDVKGKPDVRNTACMKDCASAVTVSSTLPPSTRGAHGNLAEQMRQVGPVRGVGISGAAVAAAKPPAVNNNGPAASVGELKLAQQYGCVACHGVSNRLVGPGFAEVAVRYKGDSTAESRILKKMREGGAGVWGQVPMPAQESVPENDLRKVVQWILAGAK